MRGKKLEIKVGEKHNRITLLEEVEPHITPCGTKQRQVKCLCECGREFIARLHDILNEHTKSCGCLDRERLLERTTKHGLFALHRDLFKVRSSMIQRCTDPACKAYKWYGAKGIKVCDEWMKDAQAFVEWALANGYRKGLQIDRKDNRGDYSPENCRFVDALTNVSNRGCTCRDRAGTPLSTIYREARDPAVSYECFAYRFKAGWDVNKALTTPARYRGVE